MGRLLYTGLSRNVESKRNLFTSLGYEFFDLPLIEISPIPFDETAFQNFEWIILTSQTSIDFLSVDFLQSKKIATIGEATANRVKKLGIKTALIAKEPTKQSLIECFQKNVQSGSIFYPKSNLADDELEIQLSKSDFLIKSQVVYHNQMPKGSKESLIPLIYYKNIQTICFSSSSTWARFKKIAFNSGVNLNQFKFIAQGTTTQSSITNDGFKAKLLADLV